MPNAFSKSSDYSLGLNPISSLTGSTVGDLGLSDAARKQAMDAAEMARKKKMQEQKDMANAGAGGLPSASFNSLTGMGGY